MSIRVWPDPSLSQTAPAVSFPLPKDAEILVAHMIEIVQVNNAIGLAANQIGRPERVFVMDPGESDMPWEHWNPEILTAGAHIVDNESCLSFPGVQDLLKSSSYVRLKSQTMTGEVREYDLHGLHARCAEHETDHLNGLTMLDRMGQLQRRLFLRRYNKRK